VTTLGAFDVPGYYVGDCRELLRQLPDACVDCCVTSPPYWGLRDYGEPGQLGLERTPGEYVAQLVGVFREVRRVLKGEGILWINLGDCYASGLEKWVSDPARGERGRGDRPGSPKHVAGAVGMTTQPNRLPQVGLKPKDLVGIPWSVAFALRDDGWYLRSDVIWHKPNPMPESVTDRPTKSHEYLFLLSKSERYYYDRLAVQEDAVSTKPSGNGFAGRQGGSPRVGPQSGGVGTTRRWGLRPRGSDDRSPPLKRNRRSVWTIPTEPSPDAHFATFPRKLVEPCILAGCPSGGVVLDPFAGSGTTARVAGDNGRSWLLFDVSARYAEIAKRKIVRT
jgi:DNA modification methylase